MIKLEGNIGFIKIFFVIEFIFKWVGIGFLAWLLYKVCLTQGWII